MDMQTLLIVNVSVALILSMAMGGLFLSNKDQPCMAHWTAAGIGFFANSTLSLLNAWQTLPYWLGPPLGNAMLVGTYLFFYSGISHYLKTPVHWRVIVAMLVLVYGMNSLPFARQDPMHRLLLNFPLLIAINLATVWRVQQAALTQMRSSVLVFSAVMLANLLQLLVRLGCFVLEQAGYLDPRFNVLLNETGTMAVLLYMLSAETCCMLLLVRQQTLQLQHQAESDPLTGWLNRQSLDTRIEAEWQRSDRAQQSLSLLVFDIDHFKQINDRFGHQAGDQVLQAVSHAVANELRGYDLRFRVGGEEFLVVLPNVNTPQLALICERIRQRIAQLSVTEFPALTVTMSIGAGCKSPKHVNWHQLYRHVDQALYEAKRDGRNRVALTEQDSVNLSA